MQERPERLHPFWDLIKSDGRFIQKCLKELHPFFALIKSDGGCHSSSEQEKKGACRNSVDYEPFTLNATAPYSLLRNYEC